MTAAAEMRIQVRGESVTLTAETVQATRQWYADNARACIADARSGETRVNNLESYCDWREQCAIDSLAGKGDRSLSFIQRAYALQSGECVGILGNGESAR